MAYFKSISVFLLFLFGNIFSLSFADSYNTDIEKMFAVHIDQITLQNPETDKPFEALLVTHQKFNDDLPHEQGMVLSMGIYEYPPKYPQTFLQEFYTWLPLIADYLNRQPQAVVMVPDSEFNGSLRAGALAACADYLTKPEYGITIEYLALLAGSLGSRGGLYFLEHPERYPSVVKVITTSFASPREFAPEDLTEENISKITASIGIYVGTSTVDQGSNQDAYALHDAVALYNAENDPDIQEKLEEYINGRHGFYKSYKDNPVGQDGASAREDSYYHFQLACENHEAFRQKKLLFRKWRP